MISIYKNFENGLQIMPELAEGVWVNAVDPTSEDKAWLLEQGIPQDYLDYSLDMDERARVERENGDLFILIRLPHFQGKTADIPYTTLPLGLVLTHDTLFTISKVPHSIIDEFVSGRMRGLSTSKRNRFILRLLLATATRYLLYLRQITKIVDGLEDQLQLSTRNKELLELLKYQKSLTIFTTALKSNELLVQRLQQMKLFKTYPEDEDLLEDVLAETQQAIEMTTIEINILSSMMDAFASIISNNLNSVMKLLASITIIASLPSTIAAFFGMNVDIPLDTHSLGFLIILGIALVITVSVATFFWKHDWL
jgi:magnesium transporter